MSPARRASIRAHLALPLVLAVATVAMLGAALRTSTTFDEIVLVSAGARALETGSWSLVVDQPPLMPLLYGLPVWASGPSYPPEAGRTWEYDDRWRYARAFYFESGNDPERVALLSRLVALALALGLVGLTFAYGLWAEGRRTALVGAALVAFLPDLLAHGAVAYNDVPLALAFLAAVWALDAAVRRPTLGRGAVAGALVALAFGVKFSALALGPVAVLLVAAEALHRRGPAHSRAGLERRGRGAWWPRLGLAAGAGLGAAYLVMVAVYQGDWWLIGLEHGLRFTILHASEGHPAPAYLLGRTSPDGWWYFFPLAFLFKTPAALHLLLPLALWGLLRREVRDPGIRWSRLREGLGSRIRGPVIAVAVFAAFLLASSLNAGFRYALPLLPPLLLLGAVGSARLWSARGRVVKGILGGLLVLYAGSTLSAFPWFLAYESEWVRGRAPGNEALVDSSLDWGQGLLELRSFMETEGIERVRLGYFGSAAPAGYGIAYERLPSFFRLDPGLPAEADGASPGEVGWTAISATNLHGLYLDSADPFAAYRDRRPDRILAGSLYLYRER